MRYGPLLLILFFGLLMAGVLIVTQTIASTISGVADAYSEVGVVTAEEEGKTSRWEVVTSFITGIVSGATAALV